MGFVISFSFHVYISMLIVAIAIGAWSEGAAQGRLYWHRDEKRDTKTGAGCREAPILA